jgi:hypothetical protein
MLLIVTLIREIQVTFFNRRFFKSNLEKDSFLANAELVEVELSISGDSSRVLLLMESLNPL